MSTSGTSIPHPDHRLLRNSSFKVTSGKNKIDNKSDEQLLVMQATIDANRQDYDEKIKKLKEDLTSMIKSMMDHIKILEYFPDKNYSPKSQYPITVVPDNNKDPSLEGGHSKKLVACGLSNMISYH